MFRRKFPFLILRKILLNVNTFPCGALNTEEQVDFPRKIIPAAHRILEDPPIAAPDYYHNHIFKNFFYHAINLQVAHIIQFKKKIKSTTKQILTRPKLLKSHVLLLISLVHMKGKKKRHTGTIVIV